MGMGKLGHIDQTPMSCHAGMTLAVSGWLRKDWENNHIC